MVQFQENNLKFNSIWTIFTKGYKKHIFNWFCKDTHIYKEIFIRMQTFQYFYKDKKTKVDSFVWVKNIFNTLYYISLIIILVLLFLLIHEIGHLILKSSTFG